MVPFLAGCVSGVFYLARLISFSAFLADWAWLWPYFLCSCRCDLLLIRLDLVLNLKCWFEVRARNIFYFAISWLCIEMDAVSKFFGLSNYKSFLFSYRLAMHRGRCSF